MAPNILLSKVEVTNLESGSPIVLETGKYGEKCLGGAAVRVIEWRGFGHGR